MEFNRNKQCVACDLSAGCSSVCLPTRPFHQGGYPTKSDRCLLIVGEAPGATEDSQGQSWSGAAGGLLRRLYIHDVFGFDKRLDVYLSNSVRCRPPQNATPTTKQLKACLPYLWQDIEQLEREYKEVIVLCCGATAAKAFGFKSLKDAFTHQGQSFIPPGSQSSEMRLTLDTLLEEVLLDAANDICKNLKERSQQQNVTNGEVKGSGVAGRSVD